jgi:hypothetical protein
MKRSSFEMVSRQGHGGMTMARLQRIALIVLLVLTGCGTGTDPVETDVVGHDALSITDLEADSPSLETVSVPETESQDLVTEDRLYFDTSNDAVALPECDPGEGCFLDPCQGNGDCLSGWCVEHMGQKVCTISCQEECPAGWTCSQVGASDPDVTFICVSDVANLCRPCTSTADCDGIAGTEDACVSYGDEGAFCGGKCGADKACPWGFSCQSETTVDGVDVEQCVAETGVCPCTQSAVELGLFTYCEIANDLGVCQGKRVCTAQGLSDCDASSPAEETCNGLDDDCNGLTDEIDQADGTPVCDDGNPCTVDICNGEDGCAYEDLNAGECLDGDACTIGDHCEAGVCVGQPIQCDDQDPCTDDVCDGLGGCTSKFNTAPCDDADPCTVNDMCNGGACSGYQVDCECQTDADCLVLEDGDLCNGTLRCDTAKLPHLCVVDLDTVISCPAPEAGPDAICQAAACDPATGACSLVPDHDGFACQDSDACTIGDTCAEGACLAGVALNCNDGNPCTDDSCDSATGCSHTNNTVACEDGDFCTTNDSCQEGVCSGGEALVCDDGNVCNGTETCVANKGCTPGTPLVCKDDDDVCTDTACVPQTGCVTLLNTAPCNDEDVCTTGDHCQLGACIAAGSLVCNDNNPCTNDSCDPVNGCVFVPTAGDCDDGNACTVGDHCSQGACVPAEMLTCDDGNVCTDDVCVGQTGCVFTNNQAACNDGNPCTANDQCQAGVCAPGIDLECDDGKYCNGVESCDEEAGCVGGEPPVVDDNVACTLDSCDEENDTVLHIPQNTACDNTLFCDGSETCHVVDGCQAGTPPEVDDGDPCTLDSCDEDGDQVLHVLVEPKIYAFTTCGQTDFTGPSQAKCDGAYAATTLAGQVSVSAGIQTWTVPQTGTYTIAADGAGGGRGKTNSSGYSSGVPGKGARMSGRFELNQGDVLRILVGQKGQEKTSSSQKGGGGGGGSFVVKADGTPLVVAGGGGGSGRYNGDNGDDGVTGTSGTSGNGANGAAGGTDGAGGSVPNCGYAGNSGAGFSGNGKSPCGNSYYSKSYTNGGEATDYNHCWSDGNAGGFGGGGATGPHGGGGGGGYSGGGGGGDINCGGNGGGGGGGSMNAGSDQVNQAGYQAGHGSVTISITCE